MSQKNIKCPACGSNQIERHEKIECESLTLGKEFSYKEIYYQCNSCNEEGDFFKETDHEYLIAQKKAQKEFVQNTLECFNEANISMALLERVFELPIRTLTRWKNGDFSSSSLALLRILATYPWIIDVADHKFESNVAAFALIKMAIKELEHKAHNNLSTNLIQNMSGGSNCSILMTPSPTKTAVKTNAYTMSC